MKKEIIRINLTDPSNKEENFCVKRTESFKEADKVLSKYFGVNVLDIPISDAIDLKINQYTRDSITEWGNYLFVQPEFFYYSIAKSFLENIKNKNNYQKIIKPHPLLAEGGLFIFSEEFILISDLYKQQKEFFEILTKNVGLDIPFYFLPSISSTSSGHIDCDYQIIDSSKVIYGSHNVFHIDDDKARTKLEEIAKKHNFEVRMYKHFYENLSVDEDSEDFIYEITKRSNGINSIINKALFTSSIHPEEKNFLLKKV